MAVTSIASAASATALLAAGPRDSVLIANSDANRLYILFGPGTVTASNASLIVEPGDTVAIPREWTSEQMSGIWAADGSGHALITYR